MSDEIRAQFFPMSLPDGIVGQWVERRVAADEIKALNAQIFLRAELNHFQVPPARQPSVQRLQASYAPPHAECVVFYTNPGLPVGWFYCYREDAATAFIDTVGFLPAYQGRGLYSAFLPKFLSYAAALGIERVTVSHHPNNRAIMIAELRAGFDIVGLELHESHGPLVKMAYFVHGDRRAGFERTFSMAPDPTAEWR